MTSIIKKLPNIPDFVSQGLQYEVVTGSHAYGTANKDSDYDIYGFCIPDKEIIFPHLQGEIPGFGIPIKRFDQFQKHAVTFENKEYDFTIYNIVKYFHLCMKNNPNMLNSLFAPIQSNLFVSEIGQHVIKNRHIFLHKGSYHTFKGYAFLQKNKLITKNPQHGSKRDVIVKKYGIDTKFAYHLVRLCLECKEILETKTLTINSNSTILNQIKQGEWSLDTILNWFETECAVLDQLYKTSSLQHQPDEKLIKKLLIECLEMAYGSISFLKK